MNDQGANVFLNVWESILQGDDQFSYESRGRRVVFLIFSTLLRDQLWLIRQWRFQGIDCVMLDGVEFSLETVPENGLVSNSRPLHRSTEDSLIQGFLFLQDIATQSRSVPSTPVFLIAELSCARQRSTVSK